MNMKRILILLLSVLLLAALGVAYYQRLERQRDTAIPLPPLQEQTAPALPAEPRYPVPAPSAPPLDDGATADAPEPGDAAPPAEPEEPLPELNESTPVLTEALSGLFGADTLNALFYLDEIARRFVVTVDNLPNRKLPRRNLLLPKPVAGGFQIAGEGEALTIAPDNAARYTPFVQLATSVDTQQLVAVYVRFYPLFQEAYAELGIPGAYFNDRLVEVIDHLLATPDVDGPLRVVRPHVFYQYADPELEALSAGQKTLLRMGKANAAQIKDKLRALRGALTNEPPPAGES
ncbi:MAG: DUF3014 domain-containing protein [Gammaproteobacteria bacterium]